MSVNFDEIDKFIKTYDGIKYLGLFDYGWFERICNRIKYFISDKNGITDSINHNFERIRIASYNSLLIEKIFTFHNVKLDVNVNVMLIKSVVNKNKNEYYYNIFSEKSSNKDKYNTNF